jgi:hypothetical protein
MSLSQVKIHLLVCMRGLVLIVFFNESRCWQFRILSAGGAVFGENKLYYTPEAAEKAGREWIGQDLG